MDIVETFSAGKRKVKMQKCNNAKKQRSENVMFNAKMQMHFVVFRVFAIMDFEREKAKIRQIECERTTHFMRRIFAFLVSYFRLFAFNIRKCKSTKTRQSTSFSYLRVLALLHFERKISENTTWRKTATMSFSNK